MRSSLAVDDDQLDVASRQPVGDARADPAVAADNGVSFELGDHLLLPSLRGGAADHLVDQQFQRRNRGVEERPDADEDQRHREQLCRLR